MKYFTIAIVLICVLWFLRRWSLSVSREILTPPPPDTPRINGPRLFGVRPGSPFLFSIAATGIRPMTFNAEGLPAGLEINQESGVITGAIAAPGTCTVRLTAANEVAEVSSNLEIRCGDEICLTPPMGWNSWYCWSEAVTDEHIRSAAEAMKAKGLADHGWSFVNIDDCWQGSRGGKFRAIQGNEKFPDMQGLTDYIHNLGLKAGIYSTPWMSSYGGFTGGSEPAEGYESRALAPEKRRQPGQIFGRYPRAIRQGLGSIGPRWHCDSDAKQWAAWGFDYVKYDWKPNDTATTAKLHDELKSSGRDIVFSISNTAPLEEGSELSRLTNCWRTTGDIVDRWWSLLYIVSRQKKWLQHMSPGHFNDPDMLQVGSFGVPNRETGKMKKTRLFPVEQYSQVSLWSILGAPLMLSCDPEGIDDFTFGLLSNDEVLAVNQDSLSAVPRCISGGYFRQVWLRALDDGSTAGCFFNRLPFRCRVKLKLEDQGLSNHCHVRDLWRQKDRGIFDKEVSLPVPGHGVVMVKLKKA